MRYWLFSQGQIQGPIAESALLSVPGFGPDSLVCPDGVGGNQPADWRKAGSMPALAPLFSRSAMPSFPGVPVDVGGPAPTEAWLSPSASGGDDGDILSQLDRYWTEFKERPPEGGGPSGQIENRIFELEQRLQSYDLDQKALLKKLTEKEHLLADLLAKLGPLEARLLDAEAHKDRAVEELRFELERMKKELQRKEEELRMLRLSPPGDSKAPPIGGGPIDL